MHGIGYYKQIELGISGTAFPISDKKRDFKTNLPRRDKKFDASYSTEQSRNEDMA